ISFRRQRSTINSNRHAPILLTTNCIINYYKELNYFSLDTSDMIFSDYIQNLEQIRKRISDITDKYDMKGDIKNGDDVRYSFFNQLYRIIMSYNFGLVDFVRNISGGKKVKELFNVESASETSAILLDFFGFLKNGFIYSLSTLIENYFRSIYRTLFTDKNAQKEFYEIRKEVFEHFNLLKDSDYWKALSILSNIRNCIHNNGIYISRQSYIKIEYHGKINIFRNGEAHESASLDNIISVVNDIVSLVEIINEKAGYAKDISALFPIKKP
ncbi:MAG: hypothetical protein WCR57_08560, partial [Bacteroidales bacterium]